MERSLDQATRRQRGGNGGWRGVWIEQQGGSGGLSNKEAVVGGVVGGEECGSSNRKAVVGGEDPVWIEQWGGSGG